MKKITLVIAVLCMCAVHAQLLNQESMVIFKVGKKEFAKGQVDAMVKMLEEQQKAGNGGQALPPGAHEQIKYAVVANIVGGELLKNEAKAQKIKANQAEVDSLYNQQMQIYLSRLKTEEKVVKLLQSQGMTLKDLKEKAEESVVSEALLKKVVSEPGIPTEKEIKDYYTTHKAKLPINDTLSGFQIYLNLKKDESAESIEQKKEFLNGLAAQVKLGRAAFDMLAAQNSDDPEAKKTGGRMDPFTLKDLRPEFAKALRGIEVGDITKAFVSPKSVHIFYLYEKNDGKFESYKDRIAQTVYQMKMMEKQQKIEAYLKTLEKKYPVVYFDNSYDPAALAIPGMK